MKWTDVKPTKPGWYWWRDVSAKEYSANGIPVDVYYGEGGAVLLLRGGSYGDVKWVQTLPGQWSDAPIAEPEEG